MAFIMSNKQQSFLFPPIIDDYVAKNAPVRVYDAFVDALDFKELGIRLEANINGGADEYYPKDLVKLLVYGVSYGILSSRKLERACRDNVSFIWLMSGLTPDYRTIARFRADHTEAITKILKQCVRMCVAMDLIEGNVLFVDGSKFRANASINNTWTQERCKKNLEKLDEQIDYLMSEMKNNDTKEKSEESLVKIKKEIHVKEKLVEKIKTVIKKLETQNKESINSTDDESVKAKGRQGTHAAYNVQSTVDEKNGLIVNAEAVSQSNDYNQLSQQVQKAGEILGKTPQHVCADAGYSDVDDIKKIDPAINVVVPSSHQAQEENGRSPVKPFDKKNFSYDEQTDQYTCPEGKQLDFAYLDEPNKKRYQAKGAACRACPHFGDPRSGHCTQSPNGRRITRLVDEKFKERLEADYKRPENQAIYKLRKARVEHPFGHIKRNLGAGQFLLRGRPKVNAEISILAVCFNLTRMMTILSIPKLLGALTAN